jgi:hypothetical protein
VLPIYQYWNYPTILTQLLQDFLERMKIALMNEKNPVDADLERVLPGVNQRLNAGNSALVGLARQFDYRMNELSHTVVNGFNQINENTECRKLETDKLVGCSLVEAGTNLLWHSSPGDLSTDSSDDNVVPPSHPNALLHSPTATDLHSTPNTAIVVATSPEQHRRFWLEMKHHCLLSIWNEWYGLDHFSDDFGGIDGGNKQHGSTWRKHLNASAYSRSSQLIKGIYAFALEHHLRPEEVIAKWEPLFVSSKLSTYNMVRELQVLGNIKKLKARGSTVRQRGVS